MMPSMTDRSRMSMYSMEWLLNISQVYNREGSVSYLNPAL